MEIALKKHRPSLFVGTERVTWAVAGAGTGAWAAWLVSMSLLVGTERVSWAAAGAGTGA